MYTYVYGLEFCRYCINMTPMLHICRSVGKCKINQFLVASVSTHSQHYLYNTLSDILNACNITVYRVLCMPGREGGWKEGGKKIGQETR